MKNIYFDIETQPLPQPILEQRYLPLAPEKVKLGNLRDPDKIASRIADEQAAHREAYFERAALSAMTGRVVAIGAEIEGKTDGVEFWGHNELPPSKYPGHVYLHMSATEAEMLAHFWSEIGNPRSVRLVGFNCCHFDLPFLVQRSWMLGVKPPNLFWRHKSFLEGVVDLALVWQAGSFGGYVKLDAIAEALGIEGKTGDHGANFGELWRTDADTATAYLRQDVQLCRELDCRMGFMEHPASSPHRENATGYWMKPQHMEDPL